MSPPSGPTSGARRTVRAAGGVLWRPGTAAARSPAVEVALVHRPRYDDWSLPKGKLDDDEHPLLGALREVHEETGFTAVAGRTLGVSRYRVPERGGWAPKEVRWWALRATGGRFEPNDEVDELRWLPPEEAEDLLCAGWDTAPLRLLLDSGLDTTTVLLVRHATAGRKDTWDDDDALRPLDDRGRRQAECLADLLPAYGPVRVVSAPAVRCRSTVAPLAQRLGLPVEVDEAFGEDAYDSQPERALARLQELAARPGASVVCSQSTVVPGLVQALAVPAGIDVGRPRARKGSLWALSLREGRLVDADHVPPLA